LVFVLILTRGLSFVYDLNHILYEIIDERSIIEDKSGYGLTYQ